MPKSKPIWRNYSLTMWRLNGSSFSSLFAQLQCVFGMGAGMEGHDKANFHGISSWDRPRDDSICFYHHPPFMLAMQQSSHASHYSDSTALAASRTSAIESSSSQENRESGHFEATISPPFIDFLGVGATWTGRKDQAQEDEGWFFLEVHIWWLEAQKPSWVNESTAVEVGGKSNMGEISLARVPCNFGWNINFSYEKDKKWSCRLHGNPSTFSLSPHLIGRRDSLK